ncbi:MAG: hypothetical protein JXB23_10560 [Candidatus Aminicenantes bacterium]|nr:hypothetical protein [Candidatus Aminicenantes bacterium]
MKIRGFLVILMLAVVIVFFLYTLKSGGSKDIPAQIQAFDSAKQRLTETNMETLKKEILAYIVSSGVTPDKLEDVRMPGPLTTGKWDGWGKVIRYEKLSEEDFRLTSAGNDGEFGTADDIVKDY